MWRKQQLVRLDEQIVALEQELVAVEEATAYSRAARREAAIIVQRLDEALAEKATIEETIEKSRRELADADAREAAATARVGAVARGIADAATADSDARHELELQQAEQARLASPRERALWGRS